MATQLQTYSLRKGLDLPIAGAASDETITEATVSTVALLGDDYIGLKPRLAVQEGDVVGAGAPIFAHKDTPEALVTAPVSGRIKAIHRGARRKLVSVEIEIDENAAEPINFSSVGDANTADGLVERLCASGLWGAFRTRPYSQVPSPSARPASIFVTAMDTEPLSANPAPIIASAKDAFVRGLQAIAMLTDGRHMALPGTGCRYSWWRCGRCDTCRFFRPAPCWFGGNAYAPA